MSKKIALSTNTNMLSLKPSSPENLSPPPSAEIIASNVDLLTEILLLLPARSLIKFKSVSKRWLSLISASRFACNHTHENPSPLPSGLYFYSRQYASLPLNDQITRVSVHDDPRTSLPNLSFLEDSGSRFETRVLHSSNGLMLCSTFDTFNCINKNYFICNLTTQKFAVFPTPVVSESYSEFGSYLVFDPKKSPHYRVVVVSFSYDWNTYQLDVYSSESASWKSPILVPEIRYHNRTGVHAAVWNGELIMMRCDRGSNWETCAKHDHFYIRFDIDAEKLTTTQVPFLDSNLSRGALYFGECTGRLLLVQRSWNDPAELEVLEMTDGENNFRWNIKYVVDLTPFILPSRRSCKFVVIGVVNIGVNENDLAVVLYIRGEVVQYNINCKTWKVLCDLSGGDFSAGVRPLYEDTFRFIESLTPV
ncbi:hypothetical protein RHSIM_Rhsim10G0184400 [Rhododendron simsii]|uniref:F-box domain-containing protein n=1 Tax=Rhododendron simsii TaxID=118357 RepID=A0A834G9M8_RHOSS|nr:hypothetical protein RHSIM_Rhsim10G0184400 [Rhododendron simsii]